MKIGSGFGVGSTVGTSEIENGAVTPAKTTDVLYFDNIDAGTKSAWVTAGPMVALRGLQAAAPLTHDVYRITVPTVANAANNLEGAIGLSDGLNAGGTGASDLTAGNTLQFTFKMRLEAFAELDANELMGFEISTDGFAASGNYTKNSTALRRICVGCDTDGRLWLVTCDGTSVTATDTGISVVANTAFVVRITFIAGTSAAVQIDGATPITATATLPARLTNVWRIGWSNNDLTNCGPAHFYGGAWRFEGGNDA